MHAISCYICKMFHTSTNPWQTEIFLAWHHPGVPLKNVVMETSSSSVKSDLSPNSLPWDSQPSIADYAKCRALYIEDYTQCRSLFIKDQTQKARVENSFQMHSTEGREYNVAREYYVESVYWFHRGMKFVHETKTKWHGQNINQRWYKMQ